ncbi:uncharacterized protein LOC107468065 [Arachis duranensis]|uniref:Uncharacterized protein LOC107468065 n=1 Tax=Arachis duranensis TaxID=130453 RepID=A0A6P4C470_ARADU|nr:uncharacterized protein LOC107468065 [Arachis duranensis]
MKVAHDNIQFTNVRPTACQMQIDIACRADIVQCVHVTKFGVFGSKWVKKLFYKIPIAVVSIGVKYDTFVLAADEDIRVLFRCVRSFPEVRIHELYAKLEVGVDSSGASAPVHSSTGAGDASSSMPTAGPSVPQVASPSFAADLDRTKAVGSVPLKNPGVWQQAFEADTGGGMIHDVQGFGKPDRVKNAMRDDDSDQEPVDIIGDSDDDTGANPHAQHADGGATIGGSSTNFQIGQSFQNKDEVVMSVKDYSIHRGVEYRVLESDHLKYHEKCKEFGKGCSWLIRISLRARKGTWEVRRTNAAVTVKVLQQATEADNGFRPSYRKVWMAKQKAVAQIYGDWEESYAELPRWMLGVQLTMAGTFTVLKTSPVRLGDQVDE